MWYIIKGRPESERIGGNTGSTANCVLSDICLIETADGDGTLNNVSMKDGCLWHLNVRKCYRKAYLNRMQIYKKVRKRTNLQRKDECSGILCKSVASIYHASWLKEGSGVNNDRMKKPLHMTTDNTELTNGKVNRRSTPEGAEVKTENGKHDWIVPKLTNPGRCTWVRGTVIL